MGRKGRNRPSTSNKNPQNTQSSPPVTAKKSESQGAAGDYETKQNISTVTSDPVQKSNSAAPISPVSCNVSGAEVSRPTGNLEGSGSVVSPERSQQSCDSGKKNARSCVQEKSALAAHNHTGSGGDHEVESLVQGILEILPSPLSNTPFPRRPVKAAQNGRQIPLFVNCFRMKIPKDDVYHYDVKVFPKDLDEQKKDPAVKDRYRIMRNKVNMNIMRKAFDTFEIFKNLLPVYDGQRNIYVKKALNISDSFKGVVSVTENGREKEFEVEIKYARKVSLYALHAVYENHTFEVPHDVIMVIDIILRFGLGLHLTPIGNSFYVTPPAETRDKHYVGEGKEVWFGCHQSFRPAQKGPVLNMDKSATAFYTPMSVIEYVKVYLRCDEDRLRRGLSPENIKSLTSELAQLSVYVTHTENSREYRVFRVANERPRDIKFKMERDGTEVELTVEKYFRSQYNMVLKYPDLPCLQVQPAQKNLYLPMEVCQIVEGQHYRKKFANADMINLTATPPAERFKDISRSLHEHIHYNSQWLREFGILIEEQPLQVVGRVLDAPRIRFGSDALGKEIAVPSLAGSWDMRNKNFLVPAQVSKWALMSLSRRLTREEALRFSDSLQSEAIKCNMKMPRVSDVALHDRKLPLIEAVERNLSNFKQNSMGLVVIVLESKNNDYYAVKTIAETHVGIKTQCVLEKNVKRFSPSLLANILLKVNKKMGGTSNAIVSAERPKSLCVPTMIVSADVCHSSPGEKRTPSVAAAVGSMDFHLTTFHAVVKVQQRSGEFSMRVIEIIAEFEDMMLELLEEFTKRNKSRKPERIVVYRDGVSEGQFVQVRDHEINALHTACQRFGSADYNPLITFVIVDKRHHIRFRPANRERDGAGRDGNIPPGTVVDSVVVHPSYYDFFLCSHLGLRGTSRPSRYCVLWDDSDFSADELQKITHFFCHNYASCNKAVSTPAAARYADLVAGRARQHLLGNEALYEGLEIEDLSAAQQAILVCEEVKNCMYFM